MHIKSRVKLRKIIAASFLIHFLKMYAILLKKCLVYYTRFTRLLDK